MRFSPPQTSRYFKFARHGWGISSSETGSQHRKLERLIKRMCSDKKMPEVSGRTALIVFRGHENRIAF